MTPFDGKCQNLLKTSTLFLRQLLSFQECNNFKILNFKQCFKVMEYNFGSDTIRWQVSKSTTVSHTFCASSYLFRDIKLKKLTFKTQVKFTVYNFRYYTVRWQILKSTNVSHTFLRQPLLLQTYQFFNFLPSRNRSRSIIAIFAITPVDGKCRNLQISPIHVCTSSHRFRDIKI